MFRAAAIVYRAARRLRWRPAGEPGRSTPAAEPVAGPIPAGWPEVARDQPAPPDPLADAVTRRITAAQRADLPVAGRPVPGYGPARDAGAPRSAPRHAAEEQPLSLPLSLRFRGPDGRA